MPGMGHGLQTDNPTIAAAFRSALDHQLLILVVLGVVLALAWNVARTVHTGGRWPRARRTRPVPGPWPYPEPPARRLLRLAFGLLWLFDGLLQIQGAMPLGLPGVGHHPGGQLVPRVGPAPGQHGDHHLVRPPGDRGRGHGVDPGGHRRRSCWWLPGATGPGPPGLVSAGWGLVVWVFGEAFGGVFGHGSSWLFGSPGAALFYVVAGLLVALPDRSWETPRSGQGSCSGGWACSSWAWASCRRGPGAASGPAGPSRRPGGDPHRHGPADVPGVPALGDRLVGPVVRLVPGRARLAGQLRRRGRCWSGWVPPSSAATSGWSGSGCSSGPAVPG